MATKKKSSADNSIVLSSSAGSDGTHQFDEVALAPASVVGCFGQGRKGDGFKVSRQWVFRKGELVFTLYDWKSTDLYERGMWTPEELWRSEWLFDLHVGSKHPATEKDVAEFIAYLHRETSSGPCKLMGSAARPFANGTARKNPREDRTLRAAWCECPNGLPDSIYMPDNMCPCGVDKHHYHCVTCRGISQVG